MELQHYICNGLQPASSESKDTRHYARRDFVPALHVMTASMYMRYLHVGNVTLRYRSLLNSVKELKHGFSSNRWLRTTLQNDVMVKEWDRETALFIIFAANAFSGDEFAVFYKQPS